MNTTVAVKRAIFSLLAFFLPLGSALAAPGILEPIPWTFLPGETVVFRWNRQSDVSQYYIYVGTQTYSSNVVNSGYISSSASSYEATDLPTDGHPLYVTFWYEINNVWYRNSYSYVAFQERPTLVSPPNNSKLSDDQITFHWVPSEWADDIRYYWIYAGSTVGDADYYSSGFISSSLSSHLVTGLPTNSAIVYIRYWYLKGPTWFWTDYTYTSAGAAPYIVTPQVSHSLGTKTHTAAFDALFSWTANGTSVSEYKLYVGDSTYTSEYFGASTGTNTSQTVLNLPSDGRTIFGRLQYRVGSSTTWYNTTPQPYNSHVLPHLVGPTPGSRIRGDVLYFRWSPVTKMIDSPVEYWWIYIGSSPGSMSYYHSGSISQDRDYLEIISPHLPNGTIWVRLWQRLRGVWVHQDYTYTVAPSTSAIVDADADGLDDLVETALGLSTTNPDTDGDGIEDGFEDYDLDGYTNLSEEAAGTSSKDAYGIPDPDNQTAFIVLTPFE